MEKNNKVKNRQRRGPRGWTRPGFGSLVTKQQVKNMIDSKMEKVQDKYLNSVIFDGVVPANSGTLVQPALPAQGVTNGQREGDSLSIDMIQANILFYNAADATNTVNASDSIRLICLQARANTVLTVGNASAPTIGVLDLGSSGAVDLNSFVNLNAANEVFHVLYDKTHSVNYLSANSASTVRVNLKPAVSKVNFTPGTTTSMCGGIFWIAFSIQAGTAATSIMQRLVYHDL
jgi:hypothetical protein